MMRDLTIYLGYDSKEPAAFAVAVHSILTRASKPVYIMPLTRKAVEHVYTRPRGATEATEFSMTRFLAPYLNQYQGWALFLDCDILCRVDIWDIMLHVMADPGKAVYVAQHDYVPRTATKMAGQVQTTYPRKNWSSVMLMDCAKCVALTPEYVNTATGAQLHRFHWLDEHAHMRDNGRVCDCDARNSIGALPLTWNWLVGEYDPNPDAQLLHYTLGGPWLPAYEDCDHADLWIDEYARMVGVGVPA